MKDQLAKLLESRDRESYLAIRDALLDWPDFNPDSSELNGACELLESGSLGAAQERIASSMPNLVLSPRAHLILASIAEKSQDESRARFERFFAAACTEGILATVRKSVHTLCAESQTNMTCFNTWAKFFSVSRSSLTVIGISTQWIAKTEPRFGSTLPLPAAGARSDLNQGNQHE